MPLKPGQILIERYRIDQPLGQGGSGTVYQAWDLHLDRPRALKENLGSSPEAQRQFRSEAQVLSDLRHPGLPRVIDHFVVPGRGQYLVMEYVEGEDLQSLVQRSGPLPQARALAWMRQVCDAVAYLHHFEPAVIHRDIRPANIRVTPAGMAMLVGFGIAQAAAPAVPARGYAPPEQYGQGTTDAQSDIYALGASLYTLLTGKVPDDSMDSLQQRVLPLPPAHQVNPQVSPGVSAAIGYAMQLEKSRRYATVEAFQTALTVGAMGGPVEPPRLDRRSMATRPAPERDRQGQLPPPLPAPPSGAIRSEANREPSPGPQPGASMMEQPGGAGIDEDAAQPGFPGHAADSPPAARPAPSPARLWIWMVGGLAALCLLAGIFLWRNLALRAAGVTGQLSPAPSQAILSPAAPTSTPALPPGATQAAPLASTPTQAPWQQGRLAWLQSLAGSRTLYLQPLTGPADPSPVFADLLLAPQWSPDASQIALYNRSGQLLVVEAAPGATPRHLGNCIFPSWSGDGTLIGCSPGGGNTYQLIEAATGAVKGSFPLAANSSLPVLSPVQNEIAYVVGRVSEATSLWRMGLEDGEPVLLAGEASENYAPAWSPDGQQIAYQSNEGGGASEIWVVGRDGGRRQITRTPNNGWARAPAWSPDGQWLAFVSNQAGSTGADYGEVFVVSLASGEVFQVTHSGGSIYDWRVSWGR